MASTRCPGKVMAPIMGRPLLAYLVERLGRNRYAKVVVATTAEPEDDVIANLARSMGAQCVRGPVDNLIERHAMAMWITNADIVCLAGADDPLLDPAVFDKMIERLRDQRGGKMEYVKTTGWPLGMNAWAWTKQAMIDADLESTAKDEREHVIPFWERRPDRYPMAVLERVP